MFKSYSEYISLNLLSLAFDADLSSLTFDNALLLKIGAKTGFESGDRMNDSQENLKKFSKFKSRQANTMMPIIMKITFSNIIASLFSSPPCKRKSLI